MCWYNNNEGLPQFNFSQSIRKKSEGQDQAYKSPNSLPPSLHFVHSLVGAHVYTDADVTGVTAAKLLVERRSAKRSQSKEAKIEI